jgi:uncharacterized membrane protein YkvA (DUF1232 family)
MSIILVKTKGLEPEKGWLRRQTGRWRDDIECLVRQTYLMVLAIKHPRVPWHAKLVAGCAVSYIFSPIQLIPTFIPLIGQLDDLFVLFVGMKLMRRFTPSEVLAECEEEAADIHILPQPEAALPFDSKPENRTAA